MKRLNHIIARLKILEIIGNPNIEIHSITTDSRQATQGSLFFACQGNTTDGHQFISSTIEQGANAIVCENIPQERHPQVTYIRVENSQHSVGLCASSWYDEPSSKLVLIGVTGTNGKTTIATLLYEMFMLMGHKCGLLSTVCNYINHTAIPSTHTTPDPIALNKLLADMVSAGCEYAFMEVSSHSIDQQRISGLEFNGGIFTNLTRDHLDYHLTFDAYLKAKKLFFDQLPETAFAVTNTDDKNGLVMLQNTKAAKKSYALRTLADYQGKIIESHFDGTLMQINGREVLVQFVGRFNAYNLLAVYAAACELGKDTEEVLVQMSRLVSVSGRFQPFHSTNGITAIIDYAHTPDALTNVLTTIKDVLQGKGQILTVVGAGGNRDKGKRPLMAAEAVKYSDIVILTSDNPRFEEPDDIIADMMQGVKKSEEIKILCITNRSQAIRTALMMAQPGSVVLVAGKGHENYQEIKGIKQPFDDKEEVTNYFKQQ